MSNPLLSASEQAHLDTVRSRPHDFDNHPPTLQPATAMEALTGFLARVDWNAVFLATAKTLSLAAIAYLTYRYTGYFQAFGAGAIALIGQFLIGLFFLYSVLSGSDGKIILLSSLGMYLLVNSF